MEGNLFFYPGLIEQNEQKIKDSRFDSVGNFFGYYIDRTGRMLTYKRIKKLYLLEINNKKGIDNTGYDGWLDDKDMPQ